MRSFFAHFRKSANQLWLYDTIVASLVVAVALLISPDVMATDGGGPVATAATDLGTLICNGYKESSHFVTLLNGTSYCAGAYFSAKGLHLFVKHHESAQQVPLHQPVTRLMGGGALLVLPAVMATLIGTLFGDATGSASADCTPDGAGGAGATLDAMLTNFITNIKTPLSKIISMGSITLGTLMILRALLKATKHDTDANRSTSMTHIISNLTVGTVLIVIGQTAPLMLSSLYGSGTIHSALTWSIGGSPATPQFTAAINAALTFFQVIGFLGFVRGWKIMNDSATGNGQVTMAQGMTHIIGGALCMNINQFLIIMNNTFGLSIVNSQ